MKRATLATLMVLGTALAWGQAGLADTLADYEGRFSKLSKAYAKDPSNVEHLYNLAQFYFDNSHPLRSLPMAMRYAQQAEARQVALLDENRIGELTRLARKDINLFTIRELKQAITDAAYNTLDTRTDLGEAELASYMDAFGLDANMVRLLRQRRIHQVYDEDLRRATPEAYYHFIHNYPGTAEAEDMEARLAQLAPGMFEGMATEAEVDAVAARYPLSPAVARAAERQKSRLAYAQASRTNSVEAYKDFLSRYPSSDENLAVRDRLDEMLASDFGRLRTARQYADFAHRNPDISLADSALAAMRALVAKKHDVEAAHIYLAEFKSDPFYNEVFNRYYSWHTLEGNSAPILKFADEYPDFPFQSTVERDLQRAEEIDDIQLMGDYMEINFGRYAADIRRSMDKRIAIVPLQRSLQQLVATRNWGKAAERAAMFDICFEGDRRAAYNQLRQVLATPTGRHLATELSGTYNIMHPVLNAADGHLYYTRTSGPASKVCHAVREGSAWRPAGEVEFANVDNEGMTIYSFSADGKRMLLGRGGEIRIAEKDGDRWLVTEIPPYPVNSDYRDVDAYFLPDGSGMLIASDRPGGYNMQPSGAYFHGDTALASDIYYVPYTHTGWGTPVNLGPTVNTIYSERSPILSRNLKTLYFISDGHGGLGYGDVYVSTRTDVDDWTSWSTPQNVGRELNTGYNEASITFSPDERTILLSSNSAQGRYSCYSFATWHDLADQHLTYSLGVRGLEDNLYRVRVVDLAQQAVIQVVDYLDDSPTLGLGIHRHKRYAIMADAGGVFIPAIIIRPGAPDGLALRSYSFADLVRMDKPLPLPAMAFDGIVPTPVATMQLDQLVAFLERNPRGMAEVVVDVAGRDDAKCYALSVDRGNAIRDYLMAQGLDEERISVSAYGNVNCKRGAAEAVSIHFRDK